MFKVDNDIFNDIFDKLTRVICEFKKDKEKSVNNINTEKNLNTTSITDKSPYGKVKIHITTKAWNIIDKNMDSGKVDPRPLMSFLKEENNVTNEIDFNNRFKKAQDDAKLYGIVHIDIAFNDMETLEKLSNVKVGEYYHLLWIEAAISYIKYLLNNKQLSVESYERIIKEIQTKKEY